MVVADRQGIPLGGYLCSASPAEVTLVQARLASLDPKASIQRLIADKADDSQSLPEQLADQQIELISRAAKNRKKSTTQDGRPYEGLAKRMENRTHHGLANELWPHCYPMGSTAYYLSRLFSCRPSIKSNGSDFCPLFVLTDSLFAISEIMPKSAGGKMPLMRLLCFAEALDGTAGSAAISHQLIA